MNDRATEHVDEATLDRLIDQLTLDAYGDDEQDSGFLAGTEDALVKGEPGRVVGVPVRVVGISGGPDARRGVTALCERDGRRYEVSLADVELEPGSELRTVAAAYRRWLGL